MLKKKKVFLFFAVISLGVCILFSACSGGGTADKNEKPDSDNASETSAQAPENTDKKPAEQPGGSGSTLKINIGDEEEGESAKLPDAYPSDIFPVYKDSLIVSAISLEGSSFTIMAYSKADYNEVAAFYKELLKEATVTAETDWDKAFSSWGMIDKYTYNFDTAVSDDIEGYQTSIAILLMPAQ